MSQQILRLARPTKIEFIRLRRRLATARRLHKVLKDRLLILTQELVSLYREAVERRLRIHEEVIRCETELIRTSSYTPPWVVEEFSSVRVPASSVVVGSRVVAGVREEIMRLPRGSHASTFGGNPVALKAGTEVIRIIREEKLLSNVEKVGGYVMERAREWMDSYEIVGDVRGKGLMVGIELVRDRKTKEYARKELEAFLTKCFKRGIAVIGAGFSAVRISPPLVISQELMERSMDVMEEVLKEVVREHSSA